MKPAIESGDRVAIESGDRVAIENNGSTLTLDEQAILEYVKKHEKITNSGVQMLTELKPSRARYILIGMCNKGLIKAHGEGRYRHYKLN